VCVQCVPSVTKHTLMSLKNAFASQFFVLFSVFSVCVSKYSLVVNLKNCSGSLFCFVNKIISFMTEYSINVRPLKKLKIKLPG